MPKDSFPPGFKAMQIVFHFSLRSYITGFIGAESNQCGDYSVGHKKFNTGVRFNFCDCVLEYYRGHVLVRGSIK